MEEPQKKKRLLFVNYTNDKPISRHVYSKALNSKVRRHLMVDIGKSRRKPSNDDPFVTVVWSVAESTKAQPSTCRAHRTVPSVMPPTLYTLSAFEKEWEEDSFSAYGFTLIMVAGKNAMSSAQFTNTLWFPFAFRNSAFLRHYQQLFTSPDVLIPLFRSSAAELRSLALDRSLVTIRCVESRLASSNLNSATSDNVINAVVALACYNFTNQDFDQAMIHVKGLQTVIAARGGISTLEANEDLMLMLSWVDITAALLHGTIPLFPLPTNMGSLRTINYHGLGSLPDPLITTINHENSQDTRFMSIMVCLGGLEAFAKFLRATQDDHIWDDEEKIRLFINPVTHDLLSQQPLDISATTRHWDVVSEALRLGALIWIIQVKQRCRSYPGTARPRISELGKMLTRYGSDYVWKSSPDLQRVRLWLLVLCSISGPSDQDRVILLGEIARDMLEQRLNSWEEVMSKIRRMPWIDIFEPLCDQLEQRLLEADL